MKPLNADSQSCDPISSNCVIWQGPDIECIKLCKGDTISDVIFKLATELCTVMDTLDITNYDLSCFNLTTCSPEDFQALIQFLIGRVCKLEECTGCKPNCAGDSALPTTTGNGTGCPDCTVSVAQCLQSTNQFGDLITSMQLTDYVNLIGNRLCLIIGQIDTINVTLVSYNERISALEGVPPQAFILPEITPKAVLLRVPTDIVTVLQALEEQFGMLRNATGTPDEIYQAIVRQCDALNTSSALGPEGGSMGSIPGWINSPVNAADNLANLWLTICDLRSAVATLKLNAPDDCSNISIALQLTFTSNTLHLFFTGNIPAGFQNCAPAGTMFTITDTSGGLINVFVDVVTNMNNINGVSIELTNTPLNTLNDLTVTGNPCFHNDTTNATCQSTLQETFYNVATCPPVTLTPGTSNINYSVNIPGGTATYTLEVWNATSTTLIASTTQTLTGPGSFAGSIGGLDQGTLYTARLVITINGVITECAFQSTTTHGILCEAPTNVTSNFGVPAINLDSACGFAILGGSTITTVGTTTLNNGILGLTPGTSVTGPFVYNGGPSEINSPAAISAQTDLTAAYNAAAAATPSIDMSGIDLGVGIFTPGIYSYSSSANLFGVMTLDGPGTYIFQIGSTLTTDGGADVTLINGATAENVFFQVGTSATLGTNTTFRGIIMADQSITVNGGVIHGALMARIGAVTFSGGGATTVNYLGCP